MPPPPSPTPRPDPHLIVAPPNPTTDELLRILEGAQPSAVLSHHEADPSAATSSHSPPDNDDFAAGLIASRHASRRERERELEWDEQDNARRARQLLDRLFPGEGGAPPLHFDPTTSEEDDINMELEDESFGLATTLTGGVFPPSVMAGSGEEDEDERILGFDGDDLDDFLGGNMYMSDFPERYAETHDLESLWPGFLGQRPLNPPPTFSSSSSRPTSSTTTALPQRSLPRDPSSATSYTSFLQPGTVFLGEQTFGKVEAAASWSQRNTAARPFPPTSYAAAVSGGTFTGRLSDDDFPNPRVPRRRLPPPVPPPLPSSSWNRLDPPSSTLAQPTTAHPAFAPFPSATSSRLPRPPGNGPSSSFAIPRPSSTSSSSLNGPPSSSRYAPYTHTSLPSSSATTPYPAPASSTSSSSASALATSNSQRLLDARARARERISQAINVTPSSSAARLIRGTEEEAANAARVQALHAQWEEEDEMRDREAVMEIRVREAAEQAERARERAREAVWALAELEGSSMAGSGGGEGKTWKEQEQWNVKVIIQSYSPSDKLLTGVMRACLSSSSSPSVPPPPVSDVLTHFTGHIVDPLSDGLFASPLPSSSTSSTTTSTTVLPEYKLTRLSEAESWTQLGPFKGLTKNELLERAKSREWCEERTRGWVLFRLKERGFVNVTEKESALSIAGFYHCCLNRADGTIEGLYSDPTATPFQRLALSATSATGAFSLGSFATR